MLLALLLGFAAIVIDVGFFLQRKEKIQHITDAAALAGAQELPDDFVAAEDTAREWAVRNGLDAGDIDVEFECRRGCEPGQFDTIMVNGSMKAPVTLMPVMRLLGGGSSCWTNDGCDVEGRAAAEARTGRKPIDVGLILDRTSSMSASDLANVKDGALDMLSEFDPAVASVALGILGQGTSLANPCSSTNPGVWQPVDLSNDYQTSPGALNNASRLVSTIRCLQTSSVGTNLGDPLRAIRQHLDALSDPDEHDRAIVLLTDGEANQPDGTHSTGFRGCGAQAAVPNPNNGDGNGYEQLASAACANGGEYARDMDSGNSSNTSCTSNNKDRHRFYSFGISIPGGASITGIDVRLDAAADSGSGTSRLCVELSSNNGSSWTSARTTAELGSSWDELHAGGTSDRWGRAWTPSNLADGNFMVRVTDVSDSSSGSRDFFLDWVAVNVYYDNGSGGPCEFAAREADIAKSLGFQVFTIGYGVAGARCTEDDGVWRNDTTVDLLTYMASGPENVFIEPRSQDLSEVFREIGRRLSAGYRLVD